MNTEINSLEVELNTAGSNLCDTIIKGSSLLAARLAEAIEKASLEVIEGKFDDQFIVDIFQTGSGTSTNMNANEVIASRSNCLAIQNL